MTLSASPDLAGAATKKFTLTPSPGTGTDPITSWGCVTTDVPAKYLPANCR